MAEIVNVYTEEYPALRFIGRSYRDSQRNKNGTFNDQWEQWFREDLFAPLRALNPQDMAAIGLMSINNVPEFEYWIGMFVPKNSPVPRGYEYVDFKPSTVGVSWIKGKEGKELYSMHLQCVNALAARDLEMSNGWFFERYDFNRFTQRDENGEIILDYCIFVKPKDYRNNRR